MCVPYVATTSCTNRLGREQALRTKSAHRAGSNLAMTTRLGATCSSAPTCIEGGAHAGLRAECGGRHTGESHQLTGIRRLSSVESPQPDRFIPGRAPMKRPDMAPQTRGMRRQRLLVGQREARQAATDRAQRWSDTRHDNSWTGTRCVGAGVDRRPSCCGKPRIASAHGESGDVHVVEAAEGVRIESMWAQIEYPNIRRAPEFRSSILVVE